MKIIRKKREGIKIEHNKKLFWIIIFLLALLIVLVWFISQNGKKTYYLLKDSECIKVREYPDRISYSHYERLEDCEKMVIKECSTDANCVPASCCHPDSCVTKEKAPDCAGVFCTQVCSGPLDCGAGYCGCVEGKCDIVKKK